MDEWVKILECNVLMPNANIRKPHPSLAACAAVNQILSDLVHSLPDCRMTSRRIFVSKCDTACTVDV